MFFVSVPCARLSWPYRQFSSARKYTVSYRRIVYYVFAVSKLTQQFTVSSTMVGRYEDGVTLLRRTEASSV